MKTLDNIKTNINARRYEMSDFYAVCPIPIELIKGTTRKRTIVYWRQVGMVWARLSGFSGPKASAIFNRDHATCIHAEKSVLDSFHARFGNDEIREMIEEVEEFANTQIVQNEEMGVNECISAVIIERNLIEKFSKLGEL